MEITKAELNIKENILDGVVHNFRNKIVSIGGFLTRMEKTIYARTLADVFKLAGDDSKKAVLFFHQNSFYNHILELKADPTAVRRKEILIDLSAMLRRENISDLDFEQLEYVLYKTDQLIP